MRHSFCLIYVLAAAILFPFQAFGQESKEPADSIVQLKSAKSAQLLEIDGQNYRKVIGSPARFFHNNTWLLCDTALWNVDSRVIDAMGNVKIIQEQTELQSEKMIYHIDRNLAEFRGDIVQLQDKDKNTLRTRNLDYNTKDSVAVFRGGGSMRDKDGQLIESVNGEYDSKIQTFVFTEDVNMFTDSVFVKSSRLKYESDISLATFGYGTDAWKDDNMLSANAGWYDRGREVFFFRNNVHVMSETQEGWSDSLYFYRQTSDVEMLGNAQITDTTRNVSGVAGRIGYVDSLSRVTMLRKPAVIAVTEEEGVVDTVYFGADTLIYRTIKMCDVDSADVEASSALAASLDIDPVTEFRRKAAEEAKKKAEEEAKNDPNRKPDKPKAAEKKVQDSAALPQDMAKGLDMPEDSMDAGSDTLRTVASADSSSVFPADSSAMGGVMSAVEPLDTTKIGFVTALGNVKIYRKNMQIVCDSLEYSDLDSLARFFKDPIIWNDVTQQYAADSVVAVIRNNKMEKVSLMSEAFVHMQQDSLYYNQIRGAEMMAYFNDSTQLSRFDALGGAAALFYMEENGELATVNKKESKMLSAIFKGSNIERIFYFDAAKSDAYPLAQMNRDDQILKGFRWQPEKRPVDRYAVTPLELRPSERKSYEDRPHATFVHTGIYFPGYIDDIYTQIEQRDSLQRVRDRERRIAEQNMQLREQMIKDSLAVARLDSIAVADSIAKADSLMALTDSLHVADSLAAADSIRQSAVADSLASIVPTKAQLREQARKERTARKEARIKAREEKWIRLDEKDAEKEKAKAERKKSKERTLKLKALKAAEKEAAHEAALLEKYKARLERKLERRKKRGRPVASVPDPEQEQKPTQESL